jgi:hypothetical protein
MDSMRYAYKILVRKPEGSEHFRDLVVDSRTLKWTEK